MPTYTAEDPEGTLAALRIDYHPRIAVTVDMIATGTDVKPLPDDVVAFDDDVWLSGDNLWSPFVAGSSAPR